MTHAFGIAATLSLILLTGPAFAQTADTASDRLKSSCAGDYFQFCNGMDPGGREVADCFRRNARQLSPACQAAIAESRPKAEPRSKVAKRPKRRR